MHNLNPTFRLLQCAGTPDGKDTPKCGYYDPKLDICLYDKCGHLNCDLQKAEKITDLIVIPESKCPIGKW